MKRLFRPERQLGYRILRWVLLTALVAGSVIGTTQIYLDALRVSQELDERANETLALVKEASTQAVYSIDEDLAEQVIDGLFALKQTRFAAITHPDGIPLAERTRTLTEGPYRHITDAIFDSGRTYVVKLVRSERDPTHYGNLIVKIDTAHAAELWLERAVLILVSGITRAIILGLVLYFVFHLLVNRPLYRIARELSDVDPANPAKNLIRTPPGHHKDELDAWVQATNELLLAIDDTQQKHQAAEDHISRLSRYDGLTGLPNREMFLSLLNSSLETAHHQQNMLAIFCCGLDDFKAVNEQHGYAAGDKLLQVIAERLQTADVRPALTPARLGADQFIALQPGVDDTYQAAATAEWILHEITRPANIEGHELSITATLGVALYPDDAVQADRLLQKAEQAMTLAKTEGRNQFQFYVASVDQAIRERKLLEKDLEQALSANQFHLVYQPQIDMEKHQVIGVEALIRWNHPQRGFVPPDEFIPLAELNHSIIDIGFWVLDEACRQARQWMLEGYHLRMSVNLSPIQLRQENIVDIIMGLLEHHQLPPTWLELEVTETSFMQNLEDAIHKLSRLRDQGVRIAVDDFGTGYSSLTYLKRLPVHHLKIDKQFVQDLLDNDEDTQIANTIIDLGSSLNLEVIAEGVETEEQSVYLVNRGCPLAQGYYFSRPILPTEITQFVTQFNAMP